MDPAINDKPGLTRSEWTMAARIFEQVAAQYMAQPTRAWSPGAIAIGSIGVAREFHRHAGQGPDHFDGFADAANDLIQKMNENAEARFAEVIERAAAEEASEALATPPRLYPEPKPESAD